MPHKVLFEDSNRSKVKLIDGDILAFFDPI